jgi:hypothetical protein
VNYIDKEWAELERRSEKIDKVEKIVRTISGWATAIFFFLILGKAGASDCGAPWEEIFPSTFIYCGLMILSFHIWESAGGNCVSK